MLATQNVVIYKSRATSIQSYTRMLTKCIQELFAEEEQHNYEFYIADAISNVKFIVVMVED